MPTLLIAEHDNASLKEVTAKALTAARQLGEPVHVLVAGPGARPAAKSPRSSRAWKKCSSPRTRATITCWPSRRRR
jgi:electron transfer flavoprotein alpha subunit